MHIIVYILYEQLPLNLVEFSTESNLMGFIAACLLSSDIVIIIMI